MTVSWLPEAAEPCADRPGPTAAGRQVGRRARRGEVLSYGDGRVCTTDGCETLLSRYNAAPRCSMHQ